jgi:3-hydroxybutyrate dehydrogenase
MAEQKSAIVTGSTSGIGLAVATALAEDGHNVMLNGFGDPAEIEKLRLALEAKGAGKVAFQGGDLTKGEDCAALVKAAEAAFGTVDVLVNNAGIQYVSPIEDFPIDKWNAIIALNLSAAFHTIRTAMAGMKARKYGRIVNIASAHALVASPFKSAYVSAKHGLLGLTRTVALEGATFNVRCNAICPGYVHTPLVDAQIPDTMKARNMTREQVINDVLLAAQPTKEFVKAEEIGDFVRFLLSPAANQINGTALSIDGGWTAQ